jgi:methylase of polypeptide subunit release factors
MKLDSDFWDKAWQRQRQESSLYRTGYDSRAWTEFWNQFAATHHKILQELWPANEKLIQCWRSQGLLDQSTCVLDVGSGPGTYSLPLAEAAGKVTALDTSAEMLDVLKQEADKRQLRNIEVRLTDWHDISGQKEYDLVLAANCPAISDRKNLFKMNDLSRRYAMLICYAGKVETSLRHALWREIMSEEMQGQGFDISYPCNILYREGFYPHLSFVEQGYRYLEKTETVFKNYCLYFKIFGQEGARVQQILDRCLAKRETGGLIEESMSYRLALLWWKTL